MVIPGSTSTPLRPSVYMICGLRPVYALPTADGGLGIYAYQWESGKFALDMSYLTRLSGWPRDDDEEVTEAEFDAAVAELRSRLFWE
jgi:hypothetical protein